MLLRLLSPITLPIPVTAQAAADLWSPVAQLSVSGRMVRLAKKSTRKSYRHDQCMKCHEAPDWEFQWANGYGRCWFCDKHAAEWETELHNKRANGDGFSDINKKVRTISGRVDPKRCCHGPTGDEIQRQFKEGGAFYENLLRTSDLEKSLSKRRAVIAAKYRVKGEKDLPDVLFSKSLTKEQNAILDKIDTELTGTDEHRVWFENMEEYKRLYRKYISEATNANKIAFREKWAKELGRETYAMLVEAKHSAIEKREAWEKRHNLINPKKSGRFKGLTTLETCGVKNCKSCREQKGYKGGKRLEKGYAIATHRSRSLWYPSKESIPVSEIKRIQRTG